MTTSGNTQRKPAQGSNSSQPEKIGEAVQQAIPQEWMNDITRQAENLDRSVRAFFDERPLAFVLGAVGIGIAAGLLMKRRSA